MRRLQTLIFTALLATLPGCGTEVDVGDNREKALEARALAANEVEDVEDPLVEGGTDGAPTSADGTSGADDGGGASPANPGGGSGDAVPANGGTTSGGGTALTCFGPAPALPPGFDAFCALEEPTIRTAFAASFKRICEERRLLNLFLDPCGWKGVGPSDKFRRVLDKTALDAEASQDFAFYAAYSVTTESGLEAQTALVKRELEDPRYADTFVIIKNSRVFDLAQNADGTYDYTVELASSSATVKFRAHVVFVPLSPDLTAVFDYAVSDKVIVKEHRFLRFIQRVDAGHSRIVAIDDKLVADGGNHVLAYQNLTDVLRQRMERDHENARRD